jgi:mono/diheme cytochrome c family protein
MNKAVLLLPLILGAAGCRQDMFEEPKYKPMVPSNFFTDGRSARPVPAGTVIFQQADEGEAVEQGTNNGAFVTTIPMPVNEALLQRGQERFNIYCAPCHGRVGDGHGMISKRGFIQPADLHSDRVRLAPPGYLYAVIANGYGAMPEYRDQVPVHDRWAIVAYIRALELSRRATLAQVPADQRSKLESAR